MFEVLLTSFGCFWGAEGAGARWPGADAAVILTAALRRMRARSVPIAQRASTHSVQEL